MRVTGKHGKVEGPRMAGFGLMMVGALALVLSVAGAAGAGSNTKAADPAHHTCGTVDKQDGPMAQVLQSIEYGNCGWNTTTTYKHTGCTCGNTTTSEDVSGTTVDVTTVPSTTATTMPATTDTTATSMPATTDTMAPTVSTPTTPGSNLIVKPTGGGDTTTSLKVEGITAGTVGPQASSVEPTSEVLPFTGSDTTPLAIGGFVMLAAGFGLTRTKRRIAR